MPALQFANAAGGKRCCLPNLGNCVVTSDSTPVAGSITVSVTSEPSAKIDGVILPLKLAGVPCGTA